jgi:protein-disulfide isomerase
MSNVNEKKSNTPILIIVGVLVLAALGGWWFYSSSKQSTAGNSNRAVNPANTVKTSQIPANAPQGAQPPEQVGSPTAAVTLEEFADFQCPQCAAKHSVMNEIKSMYGTRIHFIYRNYPLAIAAHDKSYDAAVAAEAAGMQGKFWDMQNLLFSNQQAWTAAPTFKQIWKDYAQKIGLDIDKWENDMAGLGAKTRVNADMERAKALGVNSTPTLYINGVNVEFTDMTVAGLKGLIDAELQKGLPQKENPVKVETAPAANTANTDK